MCVLTPFLAIAQPNQKDSDKGKALYKETCARCHSKLIGRKITGSPKLKNLDEDYITARLISYAEDKGNYTEEHKYKQKMIETAKALSASDIKNVAVYLSTK